MQAIFGMFFKIFSRSFLTFFKVPLEPLIKFKFVSRLFQSFKVTLLKKPTAGKNFEKRVPAFAIFYISDFWHLNHCTCQNSRFFRFLLFFKFISKVFYPFWVVFKVFKVLLTTLILTRPCLVNCHFIMK